MCPSCIRGRGTRSFTFSFSSTHRIYHYDSITPRVSWIFRPCSFLRDVKPSKVLSFFLQRLRLQAKNSELSRRDCGSGKRMYRYVAVGSFRYFELEKHSCKCNIHFESESSSFERVASKSIWHEYTMSRLFESNDRANAPKQDISA